MKTPIFKKIDVIDENNLLKDRPNGSTQVIQNTYTAIPSQEFGFRLSTNIQELIYFTLYELIYTTSNSIPYMREIGIGLDSYIWQTPIEEIRELLSNKLRQALSNITYIKLVSLNITRQSERTVAINLVLKYYTDTISIVIPISLEPETDNEGEL